MPLKRWTKSANFAIEGILHGAKTQKHLRYHLYSAGAVLIMSYVLGVSRNDFLIIGLAVILVLLAELMNTAIESTVDLLSPEHSRQAKIAKDVAAGAVLTTAFGAAVIGYIVLFPLVRKLFSEGFSIAKHSGEEISIISFILVLIIVIIAKTYVGKGTPLKGGIPSGHAAVAFSAWVSVTYTTRSVAASLLCLILSLTIAASRITSKIHTLKEVAAGAVIGGIITFLLFQIFS